MYSYSLLHHYLLRVDTPYQRAISVMNSSLGRNTVLGIAYRSRFVYEVHIVPTAHTSPEIPQYKAVSYANFAKYHYS